MSPKAAVLSIITKADLSDTVVEIRHHAERARFELFSQIGTLVAHSEHPRPLATYAFANDCLGVKHVYDLRLADA